ncbi:hypothetical protein QLL80_004245 [Yersinia enterocolitica]|nr:hypothetical protein [Pectobacterium atrosepticum]AIK16334.1 hypothetical protein GZ59_46520 [Pectobacterium atrosepticum]ELW7390458.1 hypothetical protein [Yersinia enterocolitica]HEE9941900.1 hypothetical protein [Citrobacter freundii]HEN3434176.1 hypothetical protein [Yersinia enterocolitica]
MEWPKVFSDVGDDIRKKAFEKFDVEAITKTTLLPGQEKTGYHKRKLTTDYYIFIFTDREDKKKQGSFCCGVHASKGWFELNGQNAHNIASYNPLTGESSGDVGTVGTRSTTAINHPKANKEKKQLINILQTYIALTDSITSTKEGESTAVKILKKLITHPSNSPERSEIRAVNTLLYKTFTDIKYKQHDITKYSELVLFKENSLGITIKSIPVSYFNENIKNNRESKHSDYVYPNPPSF